MFAVFFNSVSFFLFFSFESYFKLHHQKQENIVMRKLKSLLLMALALLPASKTLAQTNAQILYDFGTDRKYVTLTLETILR